MSENLFSFECFLTGLGWYSDEFAHPLDVLTASEHASLINKVRGLMSERDDYANALVLVFGGSMPPSGAQRERFESLSKKADWVSPSRRHCAILAKGLSRKAQLGSEYLVRLGTRLAKKRITERAQCEKARERWIQSPLF